MLKLDVKTMLREREATRRLMSALARSPLTQDALRTLATAPKLVEMRRAQAAAAAAFRELFGPLTD